MIDYPGFDPVAFELGRLKVRWYGITYLVAFAAAWWLARRRAALPGSSWKPLDVDDFLFYTMLGVIFGGRIGHVLFYGLEYWQQDAWYPLRITEGGMSFHGGLIGVLVALAVFALRRGRQIADVFDFAAALPGLGIFSVRIGNFINGELWGKPAELPWTMMVDGVARHPTQLYEAALEGLLLAAVLWWFTSRDRPRLAPSGLFLVMYAFGRLTVEFWRLPDAHIGYLAGGWFTMGHLLTLPMLLAGVALLVIAYRRNESSGNRAPNNPTAGDRASA
ncbi:MAG: prolipoprotein diacylglyceryl transferase [Gammaproteobacteria bacterium]|nr:prolipoprotein diacylglyceryl transferase [Gammaproteobacteria bacterium]